MSDITNVVAPNFEIESDFERIPNRNEINSETLSEQNNFEKDQFAKTSYTESFSEKESFQQIRRPSGDGSRESTMDRKKQSSEFPLRQQTSLRRHSHTRDCKVETVPSTQLAYHQVISVIIIEGFRA